MATKLAAQKQAIFRSVFQTDISQPTPYATPSVRHAEPGQAFGGPGAVPHVLFSSPRRSGGGGGGGGGGVGAGSTTLHAEADDQARWDRAWHTVTARIQLPQSVAAEDSFGPLVRESQDAITASPEGGGAGAGGGAGPVFYDALRTVLQPGKRTPNARHTEDILAWHTQQVRHHFIQHVLPLLSACDSSGSSSGSSPTATNNPPQVLLGSVHTLEAAHRQYLYGLQLIIRGLDPGDAGAAVARFRRDLHAMVGNTMTPGLLDALRAVLRRLATVALGVPRKRGGAAKGGEEEEEEDDDDDDDDKPTAADMASARAELVGMVESLAKVGLAGERFQMLFAEVMDALMGEFVVASYAGRWSFKGRQFPQKQPQQQRKGGGGPTTATGGGSYCTAHVQSWVEDHFSRLAVEVLGQLGGSKPVAWSDVSKWKEIAVSRLATLRIHELFDIVLQWPASRDGLEDLRVSVTTPQRRLQLTDSFSQALQRRLLHPGCSTLEILQVYISMIRTFHVLDHSKVLLDRVVHSLQLYLCQRDDAIRIVVAGLLHDQRKDDKSAADTLTELAGLLKTDPKQQQKEQQHQQQADDDLDWDDMSWVPVPVDASVNYKRPKSEDVIGTLIGALGSRDAFIKEFQVILADRLLWSGEGGGGGGGGGGAGGRPFVQEMAVLRLLRRRFGEAALQNCDVMHRDVFESDQLHPKLSHAVRAAKTGDGDEDEGQEAPRKRKNETREVGDDDEKDGAAWPDMGRLRILSRLFWPSLGREHFVVPKPVVDGQAAYEAAFRRVKTGRSLTFINNLGTAVVDLELAGGRRVEVRCKTYQAAVIYAFGNGDDHQQREEEEEEEEEEQGVASSPVPHRHHYTVEELEEKLEMDSDLIRESLALWVDKKVLREGPKPGVFTVMESLSATRDVDEDGLPEVDDEAVVAEEKETKNDGAGSGSNQQRRRAMNTAEVEQRTVYWRFVKSMLTNSAASMPLAQIATMMKMLIQGGFHWSNEELQAFLGDMVEEGELELVGGKYKLIKK